MIGGQTVPKCRSVLFEKHFYSLTNTLTPSLYIKPYTSPPLTHMGKHSTSSLLCLSFFPTLSISHPHLCCGLFESSVPLQSLQQRLHPPLSSLAAFMSLHNFLFHFLEASCARHPSTNDCQYTLEQSHFPQIAPIELLMVILGSLQVRVCACVSACVLL